MTIKRMNIPEQIKELQAQLDLVKQQATDESKLPTMIDIAKRAYSVGETLITVAEYEYYCAQTNQRMPDQLKPHSPTNPVANVTFYDAETYITWLSEYTGENYSLLTEDEFEHCCADHKEPYEDIAVCSQHKIHPVKTKKPNKYGLYDMLGCAWEWQKSSYAGDERRVVRGGSWNVGAWCCRSVYRGQVQPDSCDGTLGFRVLKRKSKAENKQ